MMHRLSHARYLSLGIVIAVSALAAAVLSASFPLQHRDAIPRPGAVSPAPSPNPLAISGIRAHTLTSGPISTERSLAPRGGCATSVVSYHSDGLKIFALASRPPGTEPAGGYPVLILAHGYITPASYHTEGTDYQDFINHFCQAGYFVLKPDYRGHGASEGSPTGGHFSPDYTYDVLNLAASLDSLPAANTQRIALLGHSMGGHVVLRALVASHHLPIKAAVTASGVTGSLEDIAYHWPHGQIPADIVPVRNRILDTVGSPATNPAFWHDGTALNYLDAVSTAIQIHHGDADAVVPLAFAQHFDAALTAAHKSHQLFIYPNGDHQFSQPAARAQFLKRTINFLDQYLKT